MSKSLLLGFTLALALAAAAQNQPSKATGAQSEPTRTKSADITIKGCVHGGERYTLAQLNTGAMFALIGDQNRLSPLDGKLAEVTATELPPDQHSASGVLPQLEVKNIKQVADTCPEQAKPSQTTTSGPAYGGPQQRQSAPAVSTPPYSPPGGADQTPPNAGTNPNTTGATGAPSPGTGNAPPPQQPPPK